MGGKQRETKTELFNGVFDGFKVRSDFKNVDVELSSSYTRVNWIKTGELDSENYKFKIFFGAKDRPFAYYLKEEVRGELGYNGLPFDQDKKMYFISRDYGSKEVMLDAIQKVHRALERCEEHIEEAKKQKGSLVADAAKFNGVFQSEQFHIEYDAENLSCYVILKGTNLYSTFKMSSDGEHKVIDIPNYKKKTYLKNVNRNKCFKYSETGYEHIKDIVSLEEQQEIKRIASVNAWLSVPENKERLQNVQITDPNDFGLIVKYDETKKCLIFSCAAYECTYFSGSGGGGGISNKRNNFNMNLAYNEILTRPEKETDITKRSESTYVADQDDNDLWTYQYGKVIFERRGDSKGKMLYLEIEKNIDELEDVKKNYEKLKVKLQDFKPLIIDNIMNASLVSIDVMFPSLYIDLKASQAYLLFNMMSVLNDDTNSYSFSCNAKPLSKDEFYELYKSEGGDKEVLYKKIQDNFNVVQIAATGVHPSSLSLLEREALMDGAILDYETGNLMKSLGVKMPTSLDGDSGFESPFKM